MPGASVFKFSLLKYLQNQTLVILEINSAVILFDAGQLRHL